MGWEGFDCIAILGDRGYYTSGHAPEIKLIIVLHAIGRLSQAFYPTLRPTDGQILVDAAEILNNLQYMRTWN